MEVLIPVIGCQLADSENIFLEMLTNDGLSAKSRSRCFPFEINFIVEPGG